MGKKKIVQEKTGKSEESETSDKPESAGKAKKAEKPKKTQKPEKNDDPEKKTKKEKPAKKLEKVEKPEKIEKLETKETEEETNETEEETNHGLKGEEAIIFEYMLHQNRPYSALNIHDNLRGAVKKAQCQKVLDKLVENNKLQAKEFGKVKIYLINQQLIPEINETELEHLDIQIKELSEELEKAKIEIKDLQIQAKELDNSLSLEEIFKQTTEKNGLIQSLENEINQLKIQGCVSEDQRNEVENKLKIAAIEEKKRLKMYQGLLSGIAEMLDEPIKKVKELIGLED